MTPDDDLLLPEGPAGLLERSGFEVVGHCVNASELIALVREHRPGLAILDVPPRPRLGVDRHPERTTARAPLAADPPQPRTGERPFYRCYAPGRFPGRPRTSSRTTVGHRGDLPDRHRLDRTRPAPGPPRTSRHRWATLAMLAHAFLIVTAAAEHARAPMPAGQIPPTRNEICHLFAALVLARPPTIAATGCDGRPGDDDANTRPAPATTTGKPPGSREDHELRQEN